MQKRQFIIFTSHPLRNVVSGQGGYLEKTKKIVKIILTTNFRSPKLYYLKKCPWFEITHSKRWSLHLNFPTVLSLKIIFMEKLHINLMQIPSYLFSHLLDKYCPLKSPPEVFLPCLLGGLRNAINGKNISRK